MLGTFTDRMPVARSMRGGWLPVLAAGALALLSASSRNAASLDRGEERDPLVQRALELQRAQRTDEAIQLLTEALERKPRLARAHLVLGQLFDHPKEDYLRALYHYQRYLELRPQTEKKATINDLIRQARLSFAASLPHPPPGAPERIAMMQKEIDSLRHHLATLSATGAAATANTARLPPPAVAPAPVLATAAPPVAVTAPPPPLSAHPAAHTYVVQPRDTLSSIAAKVYRDRSQWKKIYDANRNTLATPQSARAGQTLVIP